MNKTVILTLFLAALFITAGCGIFRGTTNYPKQFFCPVSGQPCSAEFATDYDGRTIYFADADCAERFGQDPKKYLRALDLVAAGANQRCPVSDGGIDPDVSCEYRGRTIYFAGDEQRREFKRDFEKYMPSLNALDEERGKVEGWAD